MMTLPSEHLLTFNKHKDAKSLFEAIEARFGGNEATKKTQKTLLKQMYETFNASSSESLDLLTLNSFRKLAVLKEYASFNESLILMVLKTGERLKKEKEDNQFKIDNFENASKSLDQLIGNQISDNNKKGLGYNTIPPPLTGLFAPPSIDLSNSGIEKFKQPEFEGYGVKVNKGAGENASKEVKE
ncbi:hypothetical protein Tco_0679490 [Tanacetum coccineum]|uniref:Uncharacterized protein n=1 Tax=Tanacetum coccineum TaxID=301880 RepID=A0ABQ4XI54_9ASTR